MEKEDMIDFLLKIEELTRSGLKYSTDPYAIDNYRQLEEEVRRLLRKDDISMEGENLFKRDVYPTPSVSVRTIIFSDDRKSVLMVKEKSDEKWSLPGGWAEMSLNPSDSAKKEVWEEAGCDCEILRLVGVLDRYKDVNTSGVPEYIICFEAKKVGEFHDPCFEILDRGFFPIDDLPPISRIYRIEQIRRLINAALEGETVFD